MRYNVRDKVRCVEPREGLTMNKVYEVVQAGPLDDFIRVVRDNGGEESYYAHRFVLAAKRENHTDWQLAKQGVAIPEGSITLPGPDGSIVAFKAPKIPVIRQVKRYVKLERDNYSTSSQKYPGYEHTLAFNVVDGEIDCSSAKIEKL